MITHNIKGSSMHVPVILGNLITGAMTNLKLPKQLKLPAETKLLGYNNAEVGLHDVAYQL